MAKYAQALGIAGAKIWENMQESKHPASLSLPTPFDV